MLLEVSKETGFKPVFPALFFSRGEKSEAFEGLFGKSCEKKKFTF